MEISEFIQSCQMCGKHKPYKYKRNNGGVYVYYCSNKCYLDFLIQRRKDDLVQIEKIRKKCDNND